MNRNERIAWGLGAGAAVLIALGVGFGWGYSESSPRTPVAEGKPERVVLYWYDPMVPDQHFDQPGKSPYMDMQLVPKYADAGVGQAGVGVAPQVRQNLGVRTAVASRGRLASVQRVPGTVGWNLREESVVSLPVDAVVERLFVRTPFAPVEAGHVLASVRSPDWSAALAEANALRGAQSREARDLQSAAGARLRALGVPANARLGDNGAIVLSAPAAGVVSEIAIREGQAVPAGMPMLRINGTRSVWVEAALPASASGIAAGTRVEVTADALPGERFEGRVDALLPQLDATTRARRARIVIDNPDGWLAPGQFVQVALQPEAAPEAVLVPSAAVIHDGVQARVIVQADDRFVPTRVRTGRSGDGMTEILSGLAGGEKVVVSGQFLIDSEANLSGALERLGAEDTP
jgi:Cu(I)/Ag(I) efflux system membrane fusion protein